jgi:hypothetical protein
MKIVFGFTISENENGKLIAGGRGGKYCDQLPAGGFNTAFHN